MKHVVLLVVASVVVTSGAIGFGYFLAQDDDEPAGEVAQASTQASNSANPLLNNGDDTSDSGLPPASDFSTYEQYADATNVLFQEIKEGEGRAAQTGDELAIVYTGWLTDGTIFDQSLPNADGDIQAFTFVLGEEPVIQGLERGITGMKAGGERRIVVPPSLGYGQSGSDSGAIPANAVLIFDIELVRLQKGQPESGL